MYERYVEMIHVMENYIWVENIYRLRVFVSFLNMFLFASSHATCVLF